MQTNVKDYRDIAPRVAAAWAPGRDASTRKTVFRGGFGIFYDRFALTNVLAEERYNGVVQQQYVITDPSFFPNVPAISSLAGNQSTQAIQQIDSHLRAPQLMQSAITVERQLPKRTTLAATYTNSHTLHVLRSRYQCSPAREWLVSISESRPNLSNDFVWNLQPESNDCKYEFESE